MRGGLRQTDPLPVDGGLDEQNVDRDPIRQFGRWFRDAEAAGIALHEAMTLATATAGGVPSARVVLLKGFDERGFVFYWNGLGRQVRVEGAVAKVSREESEAYFATRPLGSRLGAWA